MSLWLAVAMTGALHACPAPAATRADATMGTWPANDTVRTEPTLDSLWRAGTPFRPFLAGVTARRDEWRRSTDSARVDAMLVARGRAVRGAWRMLVVAVDACGDSMRALPVLGALDDSLANVALRIVPPTIGRAVQEANRGWNGRTLTPTIVLLDSLGRQAGCIVERPAPLRAMQRASYGALMRGHVTNDSLTRAMLAWWRQDRGRAIATEAVELLESAAERLPLCERGIAPP
jgi:hypothetical protein